MRSASSSSTYRSSGYRNSGYRSGYRMGTPGLIHRISSAWGTALRSSLKALSGFRFGGSGGGSYGYGAWGWVNQTLPGAQFDYRREAGNLFENSAVLAGLKWESEAFVEAPFCVRRKIENKWTIVDNHPLTDLIENPNGDWDESLLFMATRMSYSLDGNSYWYKERSEAGKVTGLTWVPHWMMGPAWDPDQGRYVDCYVYHIDGETVIYNKDDIVHFRDGIDPRNYRKGLSRLAAVLREVCTDNEAATFAAAMLRNAGVPPVIIQPKDVDSMEVDEETARKGKQMWMEVTTGDRRGEPFFPTTAMDIQTVAFSPQQLVLDKVQKVPETRIAAALRIPAIVLGLNAGLEHSTYANYESALKAAYHHNVVPAHKVMASTIGRSLLDEFGGSGDEKCGFDTSEVQALQEDQNDLHARARDNFTAGLFTRAESKEMVGADVDPARDDVYITDLVPPMEPEAPSGQEEPDDTEEDPGNKKPGKKRLKWRTLPALAGF